MNLLTVNRVNPVHNWGTSVHQEEVSEKSITKFDISKNRYKNQERLELII